MGMTRFSEPRPARVTQTEEFSDRGRSGIRQIGGDRPDRGRRADGYARFVFAFVFAFAFVFVFVLLAFAIASRAARASPQPRSSSSLPSSATAATKKRSISLRSRAGRSLTSFTWTRRR